jgi:hypothetical protein
MSIRIGWREFIASLGGVVAGLLAARGQSPAQSR